MKRFVIPALPVICLLQACSGATEATLGEAEDHPAGAPILTMARVTPEVPFTNDVIRVEGKAEGLPGQAVDLECVWNLNGVDLADVGCTLDGAERFDKGDRLEVTVTASSDGLAGTPWVLGPYEVANTPPPAPSVSVRPQQPQVGEQDLVCNVAMEPDIDGDPGEVEITWTMDGRPYVPRKSRLIPGDTVRAADLAMAEEWRCTAKVHDGSGEGPSAEAWTTVLEPAHYGMELLENGGFELGSLDGWSDEGEGCALSDGTDVNVEPAEGDFLLRGGDEPVDCVLRQTFDLADYGFPTGAIDAGSIGVETGVWLAGRMGDGIRDDRAFALVRYLDEDGADIGTLSTLIGGTEDWEYRQAEGLLPAGTRSLELELISRYRRGDTNDGMADAATLRLVRAEREAATITLQPMLQDFRTDAMRMLWETDTGQSWHRVDFGLSDSSLPLSETRVDSVQVDEFHFVHVAELRRLQASSSYAYTVSSGDDQTPTYHFKTAPLPDESYDVAWVADNQNTPEVFRDHVRHMAAKAPDLLVAPGDIVEDGEILSDWADYWFLPLEEDSFAQTTPVLFARGNHDFHHAYAYAYSALPENEDFYSFSYGNAFFVVLDTELKSGDGKVDLDSVDVGDPWGEQAAYLEAALASDEARQATWRIVTFHNPPYTNSRHDEYQDGNAHVRENWVDLMETEGVDLVVSGHFHSYQRGEQNGTTYVVTGGGGNSLDDRIVDLWELYEVVEQDFHYNIMSVDGDVLTWTTYDRDDEIIDQFTLKH